MLAGAQDCWVNLVAGYEAPDLPEEGNQGADQTHGEVDEHLQTTVSRAWLRPGIETAAAAASKKYITSPINNRQQNKDIMI